MSGPAEKAPYDPAIVLLARATVALEQQVETGRAIVVAIDRLGAALAGVAVVDSSAEEGGDVDDILDELDDDDGNDASDDEE